MRKAKLKQAEWTGDYPYWFHRVIELRGFLYAVLEHREKGTIDAYMVTSVQLEPINENTE